MSIVPNKHTLSPCTAAMKYRSWYEHTHRQCLQQVSFNSASVDRIFLQHPRDWEGFGTKDLEGIRYRGLVGNFLIYYRVSGSSEGPFSVCVCRQYSKFVFRLAGRQRGGRYWKSVLWFRVSSLGSGAVLCVESAPDGSQLVSGGGLGEQGQGVVAVDRGRPENALTGLITSLNVHQLP